MRHMMIALAATAMAGKASAADGAFQNLDQVEQLVAASVGSSAAVVPIDRRIKLASCPTSPEVGPVANGMVAVRCPAVGWRLAVAVNGATKTAQVAEIIVKRGDPIDVIVRGDGFSVTGSGLAMDDGSEGAKIRVKLPTSTDPVNAVVTGTGKATIAN